MNRCFRMIDIVPAQACRNTLACIGLSLAGASPLFGDVPLPFSGSASAPGAAFEVSNTNASGVGLRGRHTATTGTNAGVHGITDSTAGSAVGVLGEVSATFPGIYSAAVRGINNGTSVRGIGVWGSQNGTGWGVYGTAGGYGVFGESNGTGVRGQHNGPYGTSPGVHGVTRSYENDAVGVLGEVTYGGSWSAGVKGISYAFEGGSTPIIGVLGEAMGFTGIGVYGRSSERGTAVKGINLDADGYAGYFSGRVHVNGTLSKAAGSFKIDHPLDPANKYLSHSFVESPDMMNIYNGVITTDERGYATVELPDWFETLNRDFRYQLTIIDQADGVDFVLAKVVSEVEDNRFSIRSSAPVTKVSWQITGVRHDPYAEAHRIPVEENKPEVERGKYLLPELYGQPPEMGMNHQPEPLRPGTERPSPPTQPDGARR